jgi:hypothetical protein
VNRMSDSSGAPLALRAAEVAKAAATTVGGVLGWVRRIAEQAADRAGLTSRTEEPRAPRALDQTPRTTLASAKKTPAKKTPAKKTPAKKTPAKRTPAAKKAATKSSSATKKSPAKKHPNERKPRKGSS